MSAPPDAVAKANEIMSAHLRCDVCDRWLEIGCAANCDQEVIVDERIEQAIAAALVAYGSAARIEAIEECAKVAEQELSRPFIEGLRRDRLLRLEGSKRACLNIAAAIRLLAPHAQAGRKCTCDPDDPWPICPHTAPAGSRGQG